MQGEEHYALARKCKETVVNFLLEYPRSLIGVTIGESFWVPALLLSKVLRCHEAVQSLVKIRLSSEAASVAITEYEVRLDILFIELDPSRATTWVEHTNPSRQPWSATQKRNEIYGSRPKALRTEVEMYQALSAVKHANPLAGRFALPLTKKGKNWTISSGPLDDPTEEFQEKVTVTLSSLLVLESAAAAARLFARTSTVPRQFFDELSSLKAEAVAAWRDAFKEYEESRKTQESVH